MLDVDIGLTLGTFRLDASFGMDGPGVMALFGPSGSGKTTTAHAIAGLVRPERGHVTIGGERLFDKSAGIDIAARRRRIGYVFQDARLFPHLSVRRNLLFGWQRAGRPLSGNQIDDVIGLLGLQHLLDRRPGKLSGGEKQRVAIGRALLAAPRLLLLDEPLTALDAPRRDEILRYLERLRDELRLPMVYITHSLDEVARLADNIAVFHQGRVVAHGSIYDILARSDLFPLTGRGEAGAVIPARVVVHRPSEGVTLLDFGGGMITAPLMAAEIGSRVRVRVRARDILLSRVEIADDISANNVLPVVITGLREDADGVEVSLDCGGSALVARVTPHSRERLGLAPGQRVFAIFKTVTIDRREGPAG